MQVKGIKNAIGLILLFATAYSQAVAQKQVLTFKEAVEIALKNNVGLKRQNNQLESIQAQRLNNKAQYLPNIAIRGGGSRTDGLQIDLEGVGRSITSDGFQASVEASVPLFNGMARISNLKRSNADFNGQLQSIERSQQQVMVDVANQFLQVLLDQELLKISNQDLQTQQKLLEQIKNFYEVGTRPITDMYNQDALIKNLEVQVIRSENALRNDKSILAQILQIEPVLDFDVVIPNWDVNMISLEGIELNNLYIQASKSRSDLQQSKTQEESIKHQLRAATSGYMPSINLAASYGSRYFAQRGQVAESFGNQFFDLNPQLSYGFNFNIPLFDRLSTRNARVASKMQFDNAKNNTSNLEKTVKIEIQRAYQNFNSAMINYSASQAQLKSAELAFQTQEESYELGVSNQVELSQANQLYIQAVASKAQAELTLLFQKIILDFNVGTLKYDDIP